MTSTTLNIAETEETPEISFDGSSGVLKISGRSLPENAYIFYEPLIDWMKEYVSHPAAHTELTINLEYFNSSSGRFLLEMLSVIEEKLKAKGNVVVRWYAEKEDELMIEKGEEFASLLDIPFEFVQF